MGTVRTNIRLGGGGAIDTKTINGCFSQNVKKNNLISGALFTPTKMSDLPNINYGTKDVSFCEFQNVLYLAVAYKNNNPRLLIYYLDGSSWIKMSNPDVIPTNETNGVKLYEYQGKLYLATVQNTSPFVFTYYLDGTSWVKLPNPNTLPNSIGLHISLCEFQNTLYMAIGINNSPFINIYYLDSSSWIKMPNPTSLPTYNLTAISLYKFQNKLYMVAPSGNGMAKTYYLDETSWVEITEALLSISISKLDIIEFQNNMYLFSRTNNGKVEVYCFTNQLWIRVFNTNDINSVTGYGVSVAIYNSILCVAAEHYLYYFDGNYWTRLPAPNQFLGGTVENVSLVVFQNNLYLAVSSSGSPGAGVFYIKSILNFTLFSTISTQKVLGYTKQDYNINDFGNIEMIFMKKQ